MKPFHDANMIYDTLTYLVPYMRLELPQKWPKSKVNFSSWIILTFKFNYAVVI